MGPPVEELARLVPCLSERMLAEWHCDLVAADGAVPEVDGRPPVTVHYALTAR